MHNQRAFDISLKLVRLSSVVAPLVKDLSVLFCVLASLFPQQSNAQPSSPNSTVPAITFEVGTQKIALVVPDGFVEASALYPERRKIRESLVPSGNRLLAWFIEAEEVDRTSKNRPAKPYRELSLQVMRKAGDVNFSSSDFAELKVSLPSQLAASMRLVKETQKKAVSQAGMADVEIGTPIFLGVFHQDDTSLSTAMVVPPANGDASAGDASPTLVVMSFVLVKEKVLYLYTNTPCRSFEDIGWANDYSRKWLVAMRKANQ